MEKTFKIDNAIIKEAKDCHSKKSCLTTGGKGICRATSSLAGASLFVNREKKGPCNYYHPFGYSGFCTCPVRNAIFTKYSK